MLRRIIGYAAVSAFCFIFFIIYERFSHGVHSVYMTYLFSIPLALGVVPCLILLAFNKLPRPIIPAKKLYRFGVSALTVSSALKGVFEIAGNSSVYQTYLSYFSIALLFCGVVAYIIGALRKLRPR